MHVDAIQERTGQPREIALLLPRGAAAAALWVSAVAAGAGIQLLDTASSGGVGPPSGAGRRGRLGAGNLLGREPDPAVPVHERQRPRVEVVVRPAIIAERGAVLAEHLVTGVRRCPFAAPLAFDDGDIVTRSRHGGAIHSPTALLEAAAATPVGGDLPANA